MVCQDANAVFVAAIASGIRTVEGPDDTYRQAIEAAERLKLCEPVLKCLREAKSQPPSDYLTQQGWVLVALQNAFYSLLHADSLERGIIDSVRRGGDTDTNGCIAGALLGAVWGGDAVPVRWLDRILSCRPIEGLPGVRQPRSAFFWPTDALNIAEQLVLAGAQAGPAGRCSPR